MAAFLYQEDRIVTGSLEPTMNIPAISRRDIVNLGNTSIFFR
jgi:hypothetical protein